MLQSSLFTKTFHSAPKDELAKNAQFLIRGGFIDKLMSGVYSFLPLGLRVLNKIEDIIRAEMNAIGGQELLMPALHPVEHYETTNRDNIDVLFKTETSSGHKIVLGQSHEEVIVPLVKKFVDSYRDLPLAVYQIQTKFRNELRPKSGIFRGREFLMKDLYSLHASEQDFDRYYAIAKGAYKKIFERVGVGDKTFLTFASGGTFSKYSHEYQTLTESGEDTIYLCKKCNIAVNKEIFKDVAGKCPECDSEVSNNEFKAIEVGNIFPLKTKFSDAFDLKYKDEKGEYKPVIMGCYGIGISRLMGAIADTNVDDNGIRWPDSVAPFKVHVIALSSGAIKDAKILYDELDKVGVDVLLDDREDKSAGERFNESDLIGAPFRVVISDKTMSERKIEVKRRDSDSAKLMTVEEFKKIL
jgi:prolyl-tRNA synthetase